MGPYLFVCTKGLKIIETALCERPGTLSLIHFLSTPYAPEACGVLPYGMVNALRAVFWYFFLAALVYASDFIIIFF